MDPFLYPCNSTLGHCCRESLVSQIRGFDGELGLSTYNLGDPAGDPVRRRFDRIVRKMGVTGGSLNLRVTEELSDHRKPFTDQQSATGEGMP